MMEPVGEGVEPSPTEARTEVEKDVLGRVKDIADELAVLIDSCNSKISESSVLLDNTEED